MKLQKKAAQFILALGCMSLACLADPCASVQAGKSDDTIAVGDDLELTITDSDGNTVEVDQEAHGSKWLEKSENKDEFKDSDNNNSYITAATFTNDKDSDADIPSDVSIGIDSSGNIVSINSNVWGSSSTEILDDDIEDWVGKDVKTEAKLSQSNCTSDGNKTSSCPCGDSIDCSKNACTVASVSSTSDVFSSSCIGHGWTVIRVGDVVTITRDGMSVAARPVVMQCTSSSVPCWEITTVWVVCTLGEGDPPEEDEPEEGDQLEPEDGNVVYTAIYPAGTTHGRSTIRETAVYYPDEYGWVRSTATASSTGKYWVYNPSTDSFSEQSVAKGETYYTATWGVVTDNSYLNRYTIKEKGTSSKSSSLFWAEFIHTYAAGDSSGSTRAVNVPTGKTETFLNHTTYEPVGTVITYSSEPSISVSVPFDPKTPVTAKGREGMYRPGYWSDGWSFGGGIWGFGDDNTPSISIQPLVTLGQTTIERMEKAMLPFMKRKTGCAEPPGSI